MFSSAGTAWVLAFGLMILNTDMYNRNIKASRRGDDGGGDGGASGDGGAGGALSDACDCFGYPRCRVVLSCVCSRLSRHLRLVFD